MKPFNKVKKAASYIIAFLFLFSTVFNPQASQVLASSSKSAEIKIPSQIGVIEKSFQGKSQFPLIYIQDAHSSFEAQENIAKLIAYLVKSNGIETVYTEGYQGEIPLDQLYPFDNAEIKEKVSRRAMDYLRLSGAQYAFINRTQNFKIIGVDGMKEYLANVKSYELAAKNREVISGDLNIISKELKALGDRLYPKEIKEWLKLKDRLNKKKISMADYLSRFMKMSGLKTESAFPNLEKTNSRVFFEKLTQYENSYINRYLVDENAREVLKYQQGIELFNRLSLISITPEEYSQIELSRNDFKTETLAKFLSKNLKKTIVIKKEWENLITNAIQFYETAKQRDLIFQKNMKMDAPSILVTGGFHKDAMLRYFETNNISYILVSPKITQEDPEHQKRYDFLMSGKFYNHEKPFLNLMPVLSAAQTVTQSVLELQGANMVGENIAAAREEGAVISEEMALASSLGGYIRLLTQTSFDEGLISESTKNRIFQWSDPKYDVEIKGRRTHDWIIDQLVQGKFEILDRIFSNNDDQQIKLKIADSLQVVASSLGQYTEGELERGKAYFGGQLETTPLAEEFRPSRKEDVTAIDEITDPEERRGLITLALRSLINGDGVIATMAAGASSRMNVKEAPEEVKAMVGGRDIKSKAGVPIGIKDGQVYTFLGAFLKNIARLQEQISKRIGWSVEPTVLILSNDEYRKELDEELKQNNRYGVKENQIEIFHQELGNQFVATPRGVNEWYEKEKKKLLEEKDKNIKEGTSFDDVTKKLQALETKLPELLAVSERAVDNMEQGNREAAMLPNEKTPLGHGEFLHQLISSGMLIKLIANGNKWISVRNIDNSAATFDEQWLLTLGLFLKKGLDMQPEVSPRIKGQTGGALIINKRKNHQIAEDKQIKVSAAQNTSPSETSYWFNDAVAIFSINYVIDFYKNPGQTNDDFVKELIDASGSPEKMEAIADRGRQKFPALMDPKLSKDGQKVAMKIETNLWQSTGIISPGMKVEAVGVKGVFNIKDDFDQATTDEQRAKIAKQNRFLGTKQWEGAAESYQSNKKYIDAVLAHITEDPLFPDDVDLANASSLGNTQQKTFALEHVEMDLGTLKTKPALLVFSQEEWNNYGPDVQRDIIIAVEEDRVIPVPVHVTDATALPSILIDKAKRVPPIAGELSAEQFRSFKHDDKVIYLTQGQLQSTDEVTEGLTQDQKSRIFFVKQPKNQAGILYAALLYASGFQQYVAAFKKENGFLVATPVALLLAEISKQIFADRVVQIAA